MSDARAPSAAAPRPPWYKRAFVWEIPLLAALGALMLWVRLLPAKALVYGDRAYYIGTDPFYHYRQVLGIVRAFPSVPRWDPWTYYPNGTATNQFGTLFDWAAAAWVVATQGKDAPELYVQQVLGVYPAILGALLVVPFYFLAKRLLGPAGAIVATVTVALLPGEFLIRSIAGYSDHHVAEALMALVSILGVYVAAERGHAARDAIRARDWRAARGAILFGLLGGLALGLNFLAWPPALLFLAILGVWLVVVILLEMSRGQDTLGLAAGAGLSFALAGLMMVPVMETRDIADFNAYGPLQIVAPVAAALGLLGLSAVGTWARARGEHRVVAATIGLLLAAGATATGFALGPEEPLVMLLLGAAAIGVVAGFGMLVARRWRDPVGRAFAIGGAAAAVLLVGALVLASGTRFFASMRWGLSWVTGIGVPRTTLTIAEARSAAYFCTGDTSQYSCLANDFGLLAPLTALLLIPLTAWVLWKRRHADILLLVWSLVVFRATDTQIRFSYYLALNIALLLGWAAARIAEGVGLEARAEERAEIAEPRKLKGRKTKRVQATAERSRPLQMVAVAAVLLLVLPGNVFAMPERGSYPGWEMARIRSPDSDLVVWLEGLDWMRENTPDAAVDLSLIVERPSPGEAYDYPRETYGVLSWWDYGHWIQTTALRPPVANPFQQAAPFASLWFTERDPDAAERALDAWVGDAPAVRYVWIDDEMATGKYGAITVWANSQNGSRPVWGQGDTFARRELLLDGQPRQVLSLGPAYTETMMARLYDEDGVGLSRYRLVYEHPQYVAVGSIAMNDGNARCIHDIVPSRACQVRLDNTAIDQWRANPTAAVRLGEDAHLYDVDVHSRLKLFERVEGARLVGDAAPGQRVSAHVLLRIDHGDGNGRSWEHSVATTAGPDGRFELRFPYPTTDHLAPAEGGTDALVKAASPVQVRIGGNAIEVQVPERAVLDGLSVPVTAA